MSLQQFKSLLVSKIPAIIPHNDDFFIDFAASSSTLLTNLISLQICDKFNFDSVDSTLNLTMNDEHVLFLRNKFVDCNDSSFKLHSFIITNIIYHF